MCGMLAVQEMKIKNKKLGGKLGGKFSNNITIRFDFKLKNKTKLEVQIYIVWIVCGLPKKSILVFLF